VSDILHKGWRYLALHVLQQFRIGHQGKTEVREGQVAEKKYIGVWRWESSVIRTMMRRFPRMVVRYMSRNSA
jgi:hypothetical protein